ncbi:Vacuolar protein 8 [Zancudomyces culisetae]|uniref:Vacuolar protein 8 n=1 Tax=Zancudomyces culisetae TaxID=1213189 RepID=A0A1R1PR84_ZANCU|nr:Vacuolar protein 8 [Zancudomyces culisetae]|eukprot:OMH83423.1 Vacuolar protein 8 [Zancudomyces culisetae]
MADMERQAVNQLIQYFENRADVNFYEGEPLRALSTLAYSGHIELQKSAAIAFSEVSEIDVRAVSREALEPILYLLQSPDIEVQRGASAALGNLAVNSKNKILIVKIGGLEPLIRQMLSPNKEAQCNAVGCITNLATAEENKAKIAKSGALLPLSRLAKSKDVRVQRNATGALLNMTHSAENRQQLVNAGVVHVLVELLDATDVDVRYYCTTAVSNIAVDAASRAQLHISEPALLPKLVRLMDEQVPKIRCQAALALRNLASDDEFQLKIVRAGGLEPLQRMVTSRQPPMVLAAVACLRNLSIHPENEQLLLHGDFLAPLIELLDSPDPLNSEIACHAISTLRNLSASSDVTKIKLVELNILPHIYANLSTPLVNLATKSEMTAALAVLALCDQIKPLVLNADFLNVLLPLIHSDSIDIIGNSAAAIGNLSAHLSDYSPFVKTWSEPAGGISEYLVLFLSQSNMPTFLQIGVWTLLQLVESNNPILISHVINHPRILDLVKSIASASVSASASADNTDITSNQLHLSQSSHDEPNLQIAALAEQVLSTIDSLTSENF